MSAPADPAFKHAKLAQKLAADAELKKAEMRAFLAQGRNAQARKHTGVKKPSKDD